MKPFVVTYPEAKSLVICGDIHGEFVPLMYEMCVVQDAGYKGIAGSTKNRNSLTTLLTDSPPRHNRPMTDTQKSPSEPKIFDFSCICQKKAVPLQPQRCNDQCRPIHDVKPDRREASLRTYI